MKALPKPAAALAVPVLALLWGLNWPAVRVVLSWWSPWTLRAVGMGCGALLLFAVASLRGESLKVPADQRWRVGVSSLLTIVGFDLCTAFAQLGGSTSRAAIVTFTMPVWAVLFAWPMLGEKPDGWRLAAVGLGLTGLALLGAPLLAGGGWSAGPLFALGAGLSWAAGTVFVKRWPARVSPIAGTAWQLLAGAGVSTLGWAAFGSASSYPASLAWPAGWFWLALGFHIVLATALAYLIWFDIVARLPAGVAALGTLMIPVVGVGGAMLLLGERPSGADMGGFVLILSAATLALLAPRRPTAPG